MQTLAHDLGCRYSVVCRTGSRAASGVVSRSGASQIRHIERRILWVQEASLEEVAGAENPADLLTTLRTAADLAAPLASDTC